jgi:cytochrome c
MKLLKLIVTALFAMVACTTLAFAQERGNADEAKALVEKGIAHFKSVGPDKAFADFSDKDSGKWVSKDLYIVVIKSDGPIMAHGVNKALIGKNLIDVKDPTGKFFTREMIETGMKGSGWVDYQFTDPVTKKIAQKSSYNARLPNYDGIIAVGIYKK